MTLRFISVFVCDMCGKDVVYKRHLYSEGELPSGWSRCFIPKKSGTCHVCESEHCIKQLIKDKGMIIGGMIK